MLTATITEMKLDRNAGTPSVVATLEIDEDGAVLGTIRIAADRLAVAYSERGAQVGDRIAITMEPA